MQNYTCTWTAGSGGNSIGNGSLVAQYEVVDQVCHVRILLTWGSTTANGTGSYTFSLPTTAPANGAYRSILLGNFRQTVTYPMYGELTAGTIVLRRQPAPDAGLTSFSAGAGSLPIVPASGCVLDIEGWYQCAIGSY
jgi:hypothetical protein